MNTEAVNKELKLFPKQLLRYKVYIFAVALLLVYGFVAYRAHSLANASPTQTAVASQTTQSVPTIDPTTVSKINQLQDNSVSVQALFDQARQDPFAE